MSYQQNSQTVSLGTSLSENLRAEYGIERTTQQVGQADLKQSIKGEYDITDTVSVAAETKVKSASESEDKQTFVTEEKKVYLQYKQEF